MTGRLPLTAGELVFEIEAPSELSAEASRLVVEMKTECERLREQVLNVE